MKILKQFLSPGCGNSAPCSFVRIAMPAAFLLGFLILFPGFAKAQIKAAGSTNPSLAPWIGTWIITEDRNSDRAAASDESTVVEIRLTEDGKGIEISRKVPKQLDVKEVLIPDGTRLPIKAQDCTGWQATKWAPETGLLIGTSEMNCKSSGDMSTSTLKMIVSANQMVDILAIKVAGQTRLAVRRLMLKEEATAMESVPGLAADAARVALAKPWDLDTIIQLSKTMDTTVLEAALLEKRAPVKINTASLKKLKAAEVPAPIVDLLVAIAFPQKFDVYRNGQVLLRAGSSTSSGSYFAPAFASGVPYYPGGLYNCYYPYGSLYNAYWNYPASGFYTNGYCYNYYSPFWWDVPIYLPYNVIGTGAPNGPGSGAIATPGGYTQVEPHGSGHRAQPRPGAGYPSFGGQSGGYAGGYGSSSGAASSGGASSGGSSGGSSGSAGGSGGPSASPGGYSSGGGGGGHAGPR